MNKTFIVGRISSLNEIKKTKDGKDFLSFSIADPINKDKAQFINCFAFDKTAANIAKYFSKGDQIIVYGEMRVGTHKDSKLSRTDVQVTNWEFGQKAKKNEDKTEDPSEDLPFDVPV